MKKSFAAFILAGLMALSFSSCTRSQLSTTAGAGIGAGVGAVASGGNAGATLIGAGAGAAGGYLLSR